MSIRPREKPFPSGEKQLSRKKVQNNNIIQSDRIYTVSEINALIKGEIERTFSSVWVVGEVSDFKRAHSGHLYFTLKDEASQLRVVMWRSSARRLKFELENGLQVLCRGPVNVYEPRGQYQLIVDLVEPKGKGAMQLAFEQLKEKLSKEGLFSLEKKKQLPSLPSKIGLVTSPRGAAIVDIIRTLERRFARLHVVIYPVKVQGEGAAQEIVEGIDFLGADPEMDVLIVGRGGGSMEDLWAFNEEIVARAIYRCPVPVISAVGHEVDFTIADFVADIRASTPSAAAEMVIEKEQAFVERIENLKHRIVHHLRFTLQEKKHRVSFLVQHRAFQNFRIRLMNLEQRVDELEIRAVSVIKKLQQKIVESRSRALISEEKLLSVLREKLQSLTAKWERLSAELHNLSPLNILEKGYTLCWKDGGRSLVRSIVEVVENQELAVSFNRGEFTCSVKRVNPGKRIEDRMSKDLK
jgi:exodeoxyribonuclease VII large subunit